jgi:hypothetical protein
LLQNQGELGEAEPLCRTALAAKRRMLGDEHPSTLDSIHNLGLLLWAQGSKAEALEMLRQELEVRRRVLGEDHPHTQRSLSAYTRALFAVRGK